MRPTLDVVPSSPSPRLRVCVCTIGAIAILVSTLPPACTPATSPGPEATPRPRLVSVAPRVVSNQSAYPVTIYGENLETGSKLVVKSPEPIEVPTAFIDRGHLGAVIPPGTKLLPSVSATQVSVALLGPNGEAVDGEAQITMINDTDFPTPYALEVIGEGERMRIYVASPSTDEIHVFRQSPSFPGERLATGDRPRALRHFRDKDKNDWLVIAHQSGEIRLIGDQGNRTFTLPFDLQDIAIDAEREIAAVSSHETDQIALVSLESGQVETSVPAGVNPRALTFAGGGRFVVAANIASEDVSIIDTVERSERRVYPRPGTPIIGGHTEKYAHLIMGGKAGRALVQSDRLGVAFMSTIGPNIGPNSERMEVTQNGGVSVIDAKGGRYLRHVSISKGVPEGLALDERRALLFVADGATGRIVALDAKRLAESDKAARSALLASLDLPRPENVPLIRPAGDFGVQGRATDALHFGPKAIRLGSNGTSLYALSRFSGSVVEIDVAQVRQGRMSIARTWPSWFRDEQRDRRQGEVVYYTDLGNSRMTCDTCHPEGHVGGLLFSKGRPIRIYRGLTLRGIRESPPYFTPSRLPSIRRTAKNVLGRNRFFNPSPTHEEMEALTEYVGAIAGLPNPFVGPDGALPSDLVLPDGAHGSPARGISLFEGKAGCSAAACHPPPHFTADQSPSTRGTLHKLGTPIALMLRPEMQDLDVNYGQPPPSLVGVWDIFPLFLSGAGGNEVQSDGTVLPAHPFALRWLLENPAWSRHGNASTLLNEERNDLLAYLMTL